MPRYNKEGLTWAQWYVAATFGGRGVLSHKQYKQMRLDWEAGVCPCDWAAKCY